MVDVKLHVTFKDRVAQLGRSERLLVLETLRKLSECPDREPDRRVQTESGEVCQITLDPSCDLIYRVEFMESGEMITPKKRTPIRICATLVITSQHV